MFSPSYNISELWSLHRTDTSSYVNSHKLEDNNHNHLIRKRVLCYVIEVKGHRQTRWQQSWWQFSTITIIGASDKYLISNNKYQIRSPHYLQLEIMHLVVCVSLILHIARTIVLTFFVVMYDYAKKISDDCSDSLFFNQVLLRHWLLTPRYQR